MPAESLAQVACRILNGSFLADPNAILSLSTIRVPCNRELAEHPSVVVDVPPVIGTVDAPMFQVGMLGIVNGILGDVGNELLAMKFSEEVDADGRRKLLGFCVVEKQEACFPVVHGQNLNFEIVKVDSV